MDQIWYFDSGTSNHITSNLSNFSLHSTYKGPDKVTVGNGDALPIQHTGSGKISIKLHNFKLNNVLHDLKVSTNFQSINQLARDYSCMVYFDAENVFV